MDVIRNRFTLAHNGTFGGGSRTLLRAGENKVNGLFSCSERLKHYMIYIFLYISLYIYICKYIYITLSTYLATCLFIYLSTNLIYLSI